MKIQSLSVVVPNKACINDCAFCVSKMHNEDYPNKMDCNKPAFDLHLKDYMRRLEFARDNGCNTVMLTGTSEPQQNRTFLTFFGLFMKLMEKPFRTIEMQTTGVLLDDEYLRFLREHVGVNTISLSLSSLDVEANAKYNGTPTKQRVVISSLCKKIKEHEFTLRLSLNLTDEFAGLPPKQIFKVARDLGADQVTFRVLFKSDNNTPQDKWIEEHACTSETMQNLRTYILEHGKGLEILEFGAIRYSVDGLSVVIDGDCMSKKDIDRLKYLILRQDCKLYSRWDDAASLVF